MPKRQHYLLVCVNRRPDGNPKGACANRGSEAVYSALKEQLAERGLHKLEARVCSCSCLDGCQTGPTILVEPDHVFYGRVTLEDVPEIVDGLARGQLVERLLVTDAEMDGRRKPDQGKVAD